MGTTKQSATKATEQQKKDLMEQELSRTITSESSKKSGNKETYLPPKAKTEEEMKFALKAEKALKKMKEEEKKLAEAAKRKTTTIQSSDVKSIDGTPFTAVKNSETEKWYIVCGRNIACRKAFNSHEEAEKYVKANGFDYDLFGALMYELISNINNLKK